METHALAPFEFALHVHIIGEHILCAAGGACLGALGVMYMIASKAFSDEYGLSRSAISGNGALLVVLAVVVLTFAFDQRKKSRSAAAMGSGEKPRSRPPLRRELPPWFLFGLVVLAGIALAAATLLGMLPIAGAEMLFRAERACQIAVLACFIAVIVEEGAASR